MNSTKDFFIHRLTVIDISWGNYEIQYFALVVAYQLQLDTVEPIQRAFIALYQALENLVHVDALVTAHTQHGAVRETDNQYIYPIYISFQDDNRTTRISTVLLIDYMRPYQSQMSVFNSNFMELEVLEVFMVGIVKHNQYDYDFSLRHRAVP